MTFMDKPQEFTIHLRVTDPLRDIGMCNSRVFESSLAAAHAPNIARSD